MGLRPLHLRSWFARKRWASSSGAPSRGECHPWDSGDLTKRRTPPGGYPPDPRYGPAAPSLALLVRTETVGEFVHWRRQGGNVIPSLWAILPKEETPGGHPPDPPIWACGPFTCAFRSHGNGGRVRQRALSNGECHPWASGDVTNRAENPGGHPRTPGMGLRPLHLRFWFARKRWASSSGGAVKGEMSSLGFGRFYQKKKTSGGHPSDPWYGPAAPSLALLVRTETVGEFVRGRRQGGNVIPGLRAILTTNSSR
jgi:hypothetical protein